MVKTKLFYKKKYYYNNDAGFTSYINSRMAQLFYPAIGRVKFIIAEAPGKAEGSIQRGAWGTLETEKRGKSTSMTIFFIPKENM